MQTTTENFPVNLRQMSIVPKSTPILAEDVERVSFERGFYVERKVIPLLIGSVNEQIAKARDTGGFRVDVTLPCFIVGFPLLDTRFLSAELASSYRGAGFHVEEDPAARTLVVSWRRRHPPKKPSVDTRSRGQDPEEHLKAPGTFP